MFPIIPNIFIIKKDLSIEYLCKEVGKLYFHCGNDNDENIIKYLKSLINYDDILSAVRYPSYRYLKQEVNKKTKYFMKDLISHNTNCALSESEEENKEYDSVLDSSYEDLFLDKKIEEIEKDESNLLNIVNAMSSKIYNIVAFDLI